MKKLLWAFLCVFVTMPACAQVFQRGTIVTAQGNSIECLIKLGEWNKDRQLTYLLSPGDKNTQSIKLAEVAEVRMENFRARKALVRLDISSDKDELLSYEREPDWSSEVVLLTVLVEGKMSLYTFNEEGTARFFYDSLGTISHQLIYKRYKTVTGVEVNSEFRKALSASANCSQWSSSYFDQFVFSMENLVRHFTAENKCLGTDPIVYANQLVVREEKVATPVRAVAPMDTSDLKPARYRQYFGVEANQLIRQMFNFGGNSSQVINPYLIQYALNATSTGRGFTLGFNYNRSHLKDNPVTTPRESLERNIFWRMGYDRKVNWGKRWRTVRGFDLILGSVTMLTTTSSQSGPTLEIATRSSSWGLGPRFGLQFNLSSRVVLATETTAYLQFTTHKQSLTASPSSWQKRSDFHITLPTTLLLTVRW